MGGRHTDLFVELVVDDRGGDLSSTTKVIVVELLGVCMSTCT